LVQVDYVRFVDLGIGAIKSDICAIAVRIMSLSAPNLYLWNGADRVAAARHINDALAKQCRRYPDRLVGLASLPLKDIEASLVEIDRCVNELGMKGRDYRLERRRSSTRRSEIWANLGKDQQTSSPGLRAPDVSSQ
jgi:hypothetical protein